MSNARQLALAVTILACCCAGIAAANTRILERDVFVVSYHSDDEAAAKASLNVLSAAANEFETVLPAGDEPIRVVGAHTLDEFREYASRFSHVNVVGVARPSEGLIAVQGPRLLMAHSDYRGTLRHELVHVLLARNTNTANLPRWLNEGICMSLANEYRWRAPMTIARMFASNSILPLHELEQVFRQPTNNDAFGDAYAQALSMTRFLRDRLGDHRFWMLVREHREKQFPEALRVVAAMTVPEFQHAYHQSLWQLVIVAATSSGWLFAIGALILVFAYLRLPWRNREILERWEEEEAAAAADPAAEIASWEDVVDDPDAWKRGTEYDER